VDLKTLAELPPFRKLASKTRSSLFDAASGHHKPVPSHVDEVPRLYIQSLGGCADTLTLILLSMASALGLRSVHYLLPGARPFDLLERKLILFPGWIPPRYSYEDDISGSGLSLSGFDSPLLEIMASALNELPGDGDKELLRAGVALLISGFDAVVFDLQIALGTPFPDLPRAMNAAQGLQRLCACLNIRCAVMIRDLFRPAGRAFGDGPEIQEALSTLRGSTPYSLLKLVLEFGSEIMELTGISKNKVEARIRMKDILLSREAADHLRDMVVNAGGDFDAWNNSTRLPFHESKSSVSIDREGYMHGLNISLISRVLEELRRTHPASGFTLHKFPGDLLRPGEELFSVHECPESLFSSIRRNLRLSTDLRPSPPPYQPLISFRLK